MWEEKAGRFAIPWYTRAYQDIGRVFDGFQAPFLSLRHIQVSQKPVVAIDRCVYVYSTLKIIKSSPFVFTSTDTIIHEMAFSLHICQESLYNLSLAVSLSLTHVKHFWHYGWSEFSTCSPDPALPFKTVTYNSIHKSVSSYEFEKVSIFLHALKTFINVTHGEHKSI